jgi:hypothetical protein
MRLVVLLAGLLAGACVASPPPRPPVDAAVHSQHPDAGPGRDLEPARDAAPAPDAAPTPDTTPDLAAPTQLPPETVAIAGELHGAFLELECASEEFEFQFCIPKDMGKRSLTLKFGGDPGKRYAVALAVWGVMETIKYKDGTLHPPGFYVGGVAETPATAEYGLEIAGQTYYLNYMEIGAGEHYTYGIQYETPPIAIPGGATINLFVRDPDNYVNTNHMQSEVTDPPPRLREQLRRILAQTVQGQFVYVEVKSAVAQ